MKRFRLALAAAMLLLVAPFGLAQQGTPNYQGLWWNAPAGSESGWGINFAHQGDIIFATWFTYDLTGKAWWLTMTANKTGDNTYAGTLFETRGPAFNAVPFSAAAVTRTSVGSGTLTFTDTNNGMLNYTLNGVSQSKLMTRQVFGALPTCVWGAQTDLSLATNYQDLWWNASESGWGVNFTHQGDNIFATWFTYAVDGTPLWLSATATITAPGVYRGTLFRTTGPAFNAVPFDPSKVTRTPEGTLTITFATGNSATFAYTVNGVSQTKNLTRQVFVAPGTVCNNVFSKSWTQQQRSGSGGSLLGRLNGDLVSFGSGLMVSKDNGATWTEKYGGGGSLITAYKGQLVSFNQYFSYRSSPDEGKTWSAPQRFPGIDPKYFNSANTADCTLIVEDTLFARSNYKWDVTQVWVSRDGISFGVASATEIATLNNELSIRNIAPTNCTGTFPGPANLLDEYSAVGSRHFRQTYTRNPAWVDNGSGFRRYWDYHLEVSSDRTSWQPVLLDPSIAFAYIAEISPGRFVGIATQEGYKPLEMVGMTFLSDGNGGLTWTNVGGVPGPTREILNSLSSLDGVTIAVGWDGMIKVSRDDGISWVQATSTTTNNLVSTASGANVFVVVGVKGTILRSTDLGVTWGSQTSGVNDDLAAVAYGGGKFLAVSSSGTVLSSTDGAAWKILGAGLRSFAPLTSPSKIAYGSGAFVLAAPLNICVGSSCSVGNPGVFYSQDGGATWNKASPPSGHGMTFANGLFIGLTGIAYNQSSPNVIVSGDGGKSWRYVGTVSGGIGFLAYGNNVLAGAGNFTSPTGSGYISGITASYDLGATWSVIEIPGGVGNNLFFNGSRWVGLGGTSASRIIATSSPQ